MEATREKTGGAPAGAKETGAYAEHLEAIQGRVPRARLFAGFEAWYAEVLPTDPAAPIVDIGCGRGDFLAWLRSRGFRQVEGFDVIGDLAPGIEAESGARVHVGRSALEFLETRPGTYGAVCLLDVLEHVPPAEMVPLLAAARAALRPGGRILISGPHAACLTGIYTRYADATHTTCFTLTSLAFLLRSAGFQSPRAVAPRIRLGLRPGRWALALARAAWFGALRCIYFIESPGNTARPPYFHNRLTVVAER